MHYTFYIVHNGVTIEVEEPINWADQPLILSRGNLHGVMYEYNPDSIKFEGKGALLLQQLYTSYGSEAKAVLKIDALASGVLSTLYEGALVFKDYVRYSSAAGVTVTITTENSTVATILNNKFDNKVNLDSLVSYNGVALQPYNNLGRLVTLPSKGIFIQDYSKLEQSSSNYEEAAHIGGTIPPYSSSFPYVPCTEQIGIGLPKQVAAELGNYGIYPNGIYTVIYEVGLTTTYQTGLFTRDRVTTNTNSLAPVSIYPPVTDSAINYQSGTLNENGTISLNLVISASGIVTVIDSYVDIVMFTVCRLKAGYAGDDESHYDWLYEYQALFIDPFGNPIPNGHTGPGGTVPFTFSYTDNITFNVGDQLFYFATIRSSKNGTQVSSGNDAYKITYYSNGAYVNQFKADTISFTNETTAKLYMPNEVFSRIVEGLTDGDVRVKSDYFGRTDSQPYISSVNGPGGIAGIAPGLFIRNQQNRIPNQPFTFNISLQQAINGFNAIHNIGLGLEKDTDRPGNYERLRIESWKYFYNNNVILDLKDIALIERKYIDSKVYGKVTVGYGKYEVEEYNGIDEFLTQREYRLNIDSTNNTLALISDFITSSYAIEVTRRKQGIDSKDWRYDNDNFLIALKPVTDIPCSFLNSFFLQLGAYNSSIVVGASINVTNSNWGGVDGTYTINSVYFLNGVYQLGLTGFNTFFFGTPNISINGVTMQTYAVEAGNIVNPVNIFEPNSTYNFRYTPSRMLLHWLPTLLAGYTNYDHITSKLIFMGGTGNYQAGGEQISTLDKLDNGVIKENDTLSTSLMINQNLGAPIFKPEKIIFKYPLSLLQFMVIKNNPYGLIKYSNNYESGEGWIDKIEYNNDNTIASITLIEKR